MKIEKNIIDAVNLSKVSKIPVLFLSNPGYGKTTILTKYTNKNGMHLETLIGSRFGSAPEEISGYQVNNGGTHLEHMNPEWFDRIWKKSEEKIQTLLFIDELSTCSDAVQGTLLSLIFDRCIGNGKKLPEDTLIIAAANYYGNLNPSMNILSPTLNRFIIINLVENYTGLDLIDEFISDDTDPQKDEVDYSYEWKPFSAEKTRDFNENFKILWKETFIKYSDPDSSIGILDINNTLLDGIYNESEDSVYNFISGRTLSYLQTAVRTYMEMNLNNQDLLYKIIDGLAGNGTCSFVDNKQGLHFRNHLHNSIKKLTLLKNKESKPMHHMTNDISKDVANYLIDKEDLRIAPDSEIERIQEIVGLINKKFKIDDVIQQSKTEEGLSKFISDYEAIIELQHFSRNYPDSGNITSQLTKVGMDYYDLYCNILGIEKDFESEFGICSKLFDHLCFIKKKNSNGTESYIRAAVRYVNRMSKPTFYEILNDNCLLEQKLENQIFPSSDMKVLVWNNGFKLTNVEKYQKKIMDAA